MFARRRHAIFTAAGRVAVAVAAVATAAAVAVSLQPSLTRTASATADGRGKTDGRGEVVSAEHLRTRSADEVTAELTSDDWDAGAVRHGVDTYRLVYRTIDERGKPTTASGLLALPRNDERKLATVSFAHGTEVFKGDAPSVATDVWGSAPALTYASAGFAAVAPDYLGLGVGDGPHPWVHVPSQTSASLDMLRAARGFAPTAGRELERDVFLTGFSQGAQTALGLARALQEGADEHFRVQAVAPISGAYDVQHTEIPALLAGGQVHPKVSVFYMSYFFTAWDRLYDLYDEPGELIQAPYDQTIPELFDNEHPVMDVVAGIPDTLDELLTPRAVELLRNPTENLAAGFREWFAVCTDWTPRMPVQLYRVSDDDEAVAANADSCQAALRDRGADVPVVDLGSGSQIDNDAGTHINSNRRATAEIVRWFSDAHM